MFQADRTSNNAKLVIAALLPHQHQALHRLLPQSLLYHALQQIRQPTLRRQKTPNSLSTVRSITMVTRTQIPRTWFTWRRTEPKIALICVLQTIVAWVPAGVFISQTQASPGLMSAGSSQSWDHLTQRSRIGFLSSSNRNLAFVYYEK